MVHLIVGDNSLFVGVCESALHHQIKCKFTDNVIIGAIVRQTLDNLTDSVFHCKHDFSLSLTNPKSAKFKSRPAERTVGAALRGHPCVGALPVHKRTSQRRKPLPAFPITQHGSALKMSLSGVRSTHRLARLDFGGVSAPYHNSTLPFLFSAIPTKLNHGSCIDTRSRSCHPG